MTDISWLTEWYSRQCNGEWEHSYGVKIDTLDNPGWEVSIDIADTRYQNLAALEEKCDLGENDWFNCKIIERRFVGHGDPSKLAMMLTIFRRWIEAADSIVT